MARPALELIVLVVEVNTINFNSNSFKGSSITFLSLNADFKVSGRLFFLCLGKDNFQVQILKPIKMGRKLFKFYIEPLYDVVREH